jgi:hypothetical protein
MDFENVAFLKGGGGASSVKFGIDI